jgi:hypothetical protein
MSDKQIDQAPRSASRRRLLSRPGGPKTERMLKRHRGFARSLDYESLNHLARALLGSPGSSLALVWLRRRVSVARGRDAALHAGVVDGFSPFADGLAPGDDLLVAGDEGLAPSFSRSAGELLGGLGNDSARAAAVPSRSSERLSGRCRRLRVRRKRFDLVTTSGVQNKLQQM